MSDSNIPVTIGAILDGNRRWAVGRGLPKVEGHRAGYEKMKEFCRWAFEAGVANVLVYAFSTENWRREEHEVSYLMRLLQWALEKEIDEFHREGVSVRIIGDRGRFSENMRALMAAAEGKTKANTKGTVGILLSYGGRAEIVAAASEIIRRGVAADSITEEFFGECLWTAGIPDPDLIIRTGGEERLSNFLTWQSAYSELVFTKTLWPDFTREEFLKILTEFGGRERRFGK
ncbi:MAG: Undecaprenyl pyrophosphate synthase [Parcubacteria group bacterium GW2011_GWB1_52_7]|nr:MAG: Undecaprenyl pyrophosphate synthase [Parcubacteria group bacterium GW2011_GWA1_51_12]KKW28929.1 MAG: Undecaprenyl pyrophosphate synthase [Parcubacteria group bacterium GW2011_GWB1_52_7]KKW30927.1 MAG: Undecaprenyl pyrophosphate synthase [Parcubacteria group bacterium GW2011_GWC2_52_8c]